MSSSSTTVFTLILTDWGEGKEPTISHSVIVDGRPIETALAVVCTGQLSGVYISGVENTTSMRQIAVQATGLAARMQDAVIGAAISKALEVERKLAPEE